MDRVHLVGCAGPLFDNLAESWEERIACLERTAIDALPTAVAAIRQRRPDYVVYCGPISASSWETEALVDPNEPTNVVELTRAAAEIGTRFVLMSSDAVYAGPRMFHEEAEPVADDVRAQHIHAVEQAALAVDGGHRALVVRTHAFGWSAGGDSFAECIWRALEGGEVVDLDDSSFATPILGSDLGEILLRCLRARLTGIVHVSGAERTSPLRFAQELAGAAGFDRRLVRIKGAETIADDSCVRPRETSLASRVLRHELGVSLPLLRESVGRFVEQAANGRRDRIRAIMDRALLRAA